MVDDNDDGAVPVVPRVVAAPPLSMAARDCPRYAALGLPCATCVGAATATDPAASAAATAAEGDHPTFELGMLEAVGCVIPNADAHAAARLAGSGGAATLTLTLPATDAASDAEARGWAVDAAPAAKAEESKAETC